MAFTKQSDGCYHWSAPEQKKKHAVRLALMIFGISTGCILLGLVLWALNIKDTSTLIFVLAITMGINVFVTLISFLCMVLENRAAEYSCNEEFLTYGKTLKPESVFSLRLKAVRYIRCFEKYYAIELHTGAGKARRYTVYAKPEDYADVLAFLQERCAGKSTTTAPSEPKPVRTVDAREDKRQTRKITFIVVGCILLVFALAFTIGWSVRGSRIADFKGKGTAVITSIDKASNGVNSNSYNITADCDLVGKKFTHTFNRSKGTGWRVGTVLPVTFNYKDPTEMVLGQTPEGFARFSNIMGIVALLLDLATVGCFIAAFVFCRKPRVNLTK